jgi:transposase
MVVVAHARKLRAISDSDRKCDKHDAEMLARLARADLSLLSPVNHRSQKAQAHLAIIKARHNLVQTRTKLINAVRGMVKSFGERLAPCSPESFAQKVKPLIPRELRPALYPLLDSINNITQTIRQYERAIQALAEKEYPETKLFQSIPGVGPITALAFSLILETPDNFPKTRDVGAYVGLIPRRDQSGQHDPQLRMARTGNPLLRQFLTQCAQHTLSSRGQDSELRRWGMGIAERGGKLNRKRAVSAVSRKLAVMMLAMWKNNATFRPFPAAAEDTQEAPAAAATLPPSRPPRGGRRQPQPHEPAATPRTDNTPGTTRRARKPRATAEHAMT